ncbi:MAG TPA: M13 family metallopeptidase [Novosphingobium sp.]|nr:M13 family metallopeptidase [Novosphingobium sp.]
MNLSTPRLRALAAVSLFALALAATPARAEDPPPAPAPAAAQWGSFGIDTSAIDRAVRPGDDFNRFVNGAWIARTEIPADRARIGSFDQLDDEAKTQLKAILDELAATRHKPGSAEARIADAWRAFMDEAAIERAGLAPARPWLDRIFAAKSREDLVDLFAAAGQASPFGGWVDTHPRAPDRYVFNLELANLGLPDRDYYLSDQPRMVEIREKYLAHTAFLLGKAGYADPQGAARAVLALETDLARAAWNRALARNRDLTFNPVSREAVAALPHGALLARFLRGVGAGDEGEVIVQEMPPSAEKLAGLNLPAEQAALITGGAPEVLRIVAEAPMATWQAWLAARFLASHSATLPREIDEANFAFFGRELNGQPEQRPRWKRGIGAVEAQLGEQLGRIYVARHFPAGNKAAMEELVGNLRKAMAANLQDLGWMSEDTRKEARAKLDAFTYKIGYPARFKTYDGLAISRDTPLANAIAAADWAWNFDMAKLGQPVDRHEWAMLPQTVNAYYNWNFNEIVFPAAILQPPFFNLSADPAVNYGAIGAVIGHEIGHGFDDQGARSDGKGELRDWWTPEDKARFVALQDKLGAQYAKFCPLDDGRTCINPRLSMGENIGDLGGLSLALRAWQMSLGGKPAPVIDGLTGEQRFFMAWAQVWRGRMREERLRQALLVGPHSPAEYRINGIVRNFDEWYQAFGVQPGDALYLAPEERVRIW